MFKHHKYCVIECSGALSFSTADGGSSLVYLVDSEDLGRLSSAAQTKQPIGDIQIPEIQALMKKDAIRITDPDFLEFLNTDIFDLIKDFNSNRIMARITATLNFHADGTQLSAVTQASLQFGNKTYTYTPMKRRQSEQQGAGPSISPPSD